MNQHVIHHLSLIAESHGVYAEDLSDRMVSKYTSVGLVAVATIMVLKQYVFKPIQCWVPAEWPRPWEEYTENYCWIQNTYHVAFKEAGFPGLQTRKESEISYFQWVPILLIAQACFVLLPHAFWRAASAHSGCDPHRIVKLAMELEKTKSENKRHRLTRYVSGQLAKVMTVAAAVHGSKVSCSKLTRNCGGFLFGYFMINKLVCLLCCLAHLALIKAYLGFDELHFGWTCAVDLLQGRQWLQTRVFPRVTFCDVPIKEVGQWNTRPVQCVLPMNMINEKVYIFLWFWIVLCMATTIGFSIYWVATVAPPSRRKQFVESLLRMTHPKSALGRQLAPSRELRADPRLQTLLRLDGVFILHMVAAKCGDLCAAQILEGMNHEAAEEAVDASTLDPLMTPELAKTLPLRHLGLGDSGGGSRDGGDSKGGNNGRVFGPASDV